MKIRLAWQDLRATFWFIPAALVAAGLGLAVALVSAHDVIAKGTFERWPRLFGAGAEGARGLLATVASSMITVGGVVFSITIVALSLASNQYTSRVLRNFMSDWVNQSVLGVFVGVFVYCLAVLRTIRAEDEGTFVPSLAVFVALLLALAGVAVLVYFVHHISVSIQAAHILANVAAETAEAVDRSFPDHADDVEQPLDTSDPHRWHCVAAPRSGFVQNVDRDGLVQWAAEKHTLVRLERSVGEFVIEGTPLVSVLDWQPDERNSTGLLGMFAIERQRVVYHDPAFGIRLIVDVALKALSPGINDTTTAVLAIDYLTVILLRLGQRTMPTSHRDEDGRTRLLDDGPRYACFIDGAFDQIRSSAMKNFAILDQLLASIETLARGAPQASRRNVLREHADALAWACEQGLEMPRERARANQRLARLTQLLED